MSADIVAGVERNCGTRDASRRLHFVEKDKDHRSSLYDDAWDVPNAAHHLERPRAAWRSVARIRALARLRADALWVAEKPFDKVRIGTRVIISPSDAEPVEFSHPALFVPKCYRGPPERRISVDLPSSWISAAVA